MQIMREFYDHNKNVLADCYIHIVHNRRPHLKMKSLLKIHSIKLLFTCIQKDSITIHQQYSRIFSLRLRLVLTTL